MQLNLVPKIVLFVFVIFGIGVGGLAYLSFQDAQYLLREQALLRLGENVNKEGVALMEQGFNLPRSDVIIISESEAIKTVFQSSGYDPEFDGHGDWRTSLEKVFYSMLTHRPNYSQIRLIALDVDGVGAEIVRLDQRDGEITITEDEDLQIKSHRMYFQETIKLKKGEVYVSDVDLNREYGEIEQPPVPTFRVATPVISDSGVVLGIIVINIKFLPVIEPLFTPPENVFYFLARQNGEYLYHTDKAKNSKINYDRSGGDSLLNDFKAVDILTDLGDQKGIDETFKMNVFEKSVGLSFSHLHFDPLNPERKFILGATASYDYINEKSIFFLNKLSILTVMMMAFMSMLLAFAVHYIVSPIKKLTEITEDITGGSENIDVPDFGQDEVGKLAHAFKLMIQAKNKTFKELKQSREVIENLVDGVITINEEGKIVGFSSVAAKIFGYTEKEVLDKNVSILMPEPHARNHNNYLQDYFGTRDKKIIGKIREVVGLRKDGSEFPMEISVGEVTLDDKTIFIGSVRDITKKKEVEEALYQAKRDAEQAGVAKSQFLARMSHEIRTPMNGIIGTVSLIEDTNLTEKQKNYLRIIKTSGQSLLIIVNEILDFSSLEAGKIEIVNEPFEIYHCVDAVYHLFQAQTNDKGLEFKLVYKKLPALIKGDKGRVRQVIINLLNNAIKFTDSGLVTLEVGLLDVGENQQYIKFSVHDSGVGISEKGQEKLFEAFSQVDISATRKAEGTGLGLSISKALVEMMGGKIGFGSVQGEGSTFWFTIPVVIPSEEELREFSRTLVKGDVGQSYQYKASVLVVEDVEVNRVVAMEMLEGYGCNVDYAEDGKIALEKMSEKEYDIIFMDCQMPVMDGFEATSEIRKFNRDIPIVALTANVLAKEREKCFSSGMNDFVAKPFTKEVFASVLNKWIPNCVVVDSEFDIERDNVKPEDAGKDEDDGPIDFNVLEQFGENVGKIIELTLKDADKFMENLEISVEQKNIEDIGIDAHSLKSVAAQVGGLKLSKIAKALEMKGKARDMSDVPEIFAKLKSEYALFKHVLLKV